MPRRNDPHYVIGARAHQANAHHITALAECHWQEHGASNAKTILINGTVISVDSAPSSSNQCTMTLITVDYELLCGGGTIMRCQELNSRGVNCLRQNRRAIRLMNT